MDQPKPHISQFGDFRLDASRRLLLRSGELVPLTPKVFDTLLYLVEHCGMLLSKEELMAAVWPDTVVEENNLGQNISKLRVVLGESRTENRYIATVPGRGYRFVAAVSVLSDDTEPADTVSPVHAKEVRLAPTRSERVRHPLPWRAVLVGGLVATLSFSAFYIWSSRRRTALTAPVKTIAVLPFKPLLPQSRDEALELGMADALITTLSRSNEINVRPINAVRRFGGIEQDAVSAGRELGVDAVLDGTIQRWGDRIRVEVRLLRTADNSTLWADQLDERFGDIFAVQDSISARVASALALKLAGEKPALSTNRYTSDAEAYDLYLKGRLFWAKRSRESTTQAIDYFQQALKRDPTYALAYAGLAHCYIGLPIMAEVPSREAFPKAREAALKALQIDEQLAEAHAALGWINFWFDWDWEACDKELRRALELDPKYSLAHMFHAHLMSNLGRHDEALQEIDVALKLEPLSPLALSIKGVLLYQARRYQQGIDHLNKALEIDPNFWIGQLALGANYERAGRYEDALKAFRKGWDTSGGNTQALSLSGYTYAVSGRRAEAEQSLQELKRISNEKYVPSSNVALVYLGLGNVDETLKWLEKAHEERDVHMVFLGVDPKWDPLRNNTRFLELLEQMKLRK